MYGLESSTYEEDIAAVGARVLADAEESSTIGGLRRLECKEGVAVTGVKVLADEFFDLPRHLGIC